MQSGNHPVSFSIITLIGIIMVESLDIKSPKSPRHKITEMVEVKIAFNFFNPKICIAPFCNCAHSNCVLMRGLDSGFPDIELHCTLSVMQIGTCNNHDDNIGTPF